MIEYFENDFSNDDIKFVIEECDDPKWLKEHKFVLIFRGDNYDKVFNNSYEGDDDNDELKEEIQQYFVDIRLQQAKASEHGTRPEAIKILGFIPYLYDIYYYNFVVSNIGVIFFMNKHDALSFKITWG